MIDRDLTTLPAAAAAGGARAAAGVPSGRALARVRIGMLVALTRADLRARYGRGPWQLVKWMLDPFALVGVYLLLVAFVLRRGGAATGLSIACAVIPFQLLITTVINAMSSVAVRRAIILNMSFERTLIPASAVCTETIAFSASLLLIPLLMAGYGVAPTLALLWLPVVLLVTVVVVLGVAYPASLFGLWFPDMRWLAISFVRTLFFLAAGIVPLASITGRTHDLVVVNPLTGLFEAYRSVLLYGHRPALWQFAVPLGFALTLLCLFVPLYRVEQRHFAKVVE